MRTLLPLLILACVLCAGPAAAGQPKSKTPEAIARQLDTNNDGNITKEEFKAGVQKLDDVTAFHVADVDHDKDGVIKAEELAKGWQKSGADVMAMKVSDVDANKDGKVTWKEIYLRYPTFLDSVYAHADKDRSGGISQKEAVTLFQF